MDEKYTASVIKIDKQDGFTLVELIVVVAIIAILSAMSITYLAFLKFRSGDSQAFVEGRNLLTAVNDAFLNLEDIDFGNASADTTGDVGDRTNGGGERTPIFTLSSEIRARLDGKSTPSPGGGYITAYIWSINGSNDPDATYSGKKEYIYYIDEDSGEIITPAF